MLSSSLRFGSLSNAFAGVLAAAGKVCAEASCGGVLDYVGPSTCDAAGICVEPAPQSCLHNNPCKFDLCDTSKGCDQVTKFDGTPCDVGMVCTNGVCGAPMSTSSSSSSSSSVSSASSSSSSASGAGGA